MAVTFAGASRLTLVVPLAAAVTIVLFILMQMLIRSEFLVIDPPEDRPRIVIAEYVVPIEIKRELPEAPDPVTPPELPELTVDIVNPGSSGDGVPVGPIMIGIPAIEPLDSGSIAFQPDPGPIVRVEPVYPPRMSERGVEGRCIVRFDVLGSGQTANIEILSCARGFESASSNAVRDWRYGASDRVSAGEIALRGLTTQFDYELD